MSLDRIIVFAISKEEIEAGDISRFLAMFRPAQMSSQYLRDLFACVSFTVSGYDNSAEELYLISKVRTYFQQVHKEWPCWLFYAELLSPCLRMVMLSILPDICAKQQSGGQSTLVTYNAQQLCHFLRDSVPVLERLSTMAGLAEAEIEQRTRELLCYFDIS